MTGSATLAQISRTSVATRDHRILERRGETAAMGARLRALRNDRIDAGLRQAARFFHRGRRAADGDAARLERRDLLG